MKISGNRPKVVIIGGGFGGLLAAKSLRHAPVDVLVLDRSNHHLFQPLLYQVATAALSPADIAVPIRSILRRNENTDVLLAEVQGIDRARKVVQASDGAEYPYDWLIIATGARHSYFGRQDWEKFAPGLKSVVDATAIRRNILLAFEKAEKETDPEKRRALLNFVIVGGGPTGVEMAGSIAELAHRALSADFRHINPASARVVLLEAGPRVLAAFAPDLSDYATRALSKLGVEVMTGSRVEQVDEEGVVYNGQRLGAKTLIWAAGVVASPAGHWLGAEMDRAGRVQVQPDLTVPGSPDIFVIGDTAAAQDESGKPLPGVAPVAMQQGRFVAQVIAERATARAAGAPPPATRPFRYLDKGSLATIGRRSGVAQIGRIRLKGFDAWITWLVVHIAYLIGFRNRIIVLIQWAWNYITYRRGARLITMEGGANPESGPGYAMHSGASQAPQSKDARRIS